MKIYDKTSCSQLLERAFAAREKELAAVKQILSDVRARGDAAVFDYEQKFDGTSLTRENFRVSEAEFEAAYGAVSPELLVSLKKAINNIYAYHSRAGRKDSVETHDGRTQVTIEYSAEGEPLRVDTVVVSTQHSAEAELAQIRADMIEHVILPTIPAELNKGDIKCYVNPTGRFVKGGPAADSGLTGRKIIVDTYGGSAPHGGGCFSGKDPTKVDRSAAYAARWIAKNIVAAGLARRCQVQLAYAIGVANPVSVNVTTFGTGAVPDSELERAIGEVFDLRPAAIIRDLGLRKPIYRRLAAYGHMGREDLGVAWERTDRVRQLLAALGR